MVTARSPTSNIHEKMIWRPLDHHLKIAQEDDLLRNDKSHYRELLQLIINLHIQITNTL
jgi:hypothetical protein